jgi:uncharacterized membrane protein YoaK (UPF0700 family)
MTINNEIKKIKERRESRTILAFFVGAFLGGIFSLDFFLGILAGTVIAIIIWTGYSDEIAAREKERTLNGR